MSPINHTECFNREVFSRPPQLRKPAAAHFLFPTSHRAIYSVTVVCRVAAQSQFPADRNRCRRRRPRRGRKERERIVVRVGAVELTSSVFPADSISPSFYSGSHMVTWLFLSLSLQSNVFTASDGLLCGMCIMLHCDRKFPEQQLALLFEARPHEAEKGNQFHFAILQLQMFTNGASALDRFICNCKIGS